MTKANAKTNIVGDEARAFLDLTTTFVLDVRTPQEFKGGALKRAVLIPINELSKRLAELPDNKDAPILVYCAHGVRSLVAQDFLKHQGYTHVVNLAGGIAAYPHAK